ncbi:MAG: lactate utilization protein [Elusimicrobiota bacterium]|nr:lactate utilization protein [Elusimicrobiota bacterium]
MDESIRKFNKKLLDKVAQALNKNGFEDVSVLDTKSDAVKKILQLIPENSKVGLGGSMTIREIGLVDELSRAGKKCRILQHKPGMSIEERKTLWREVFSCDFYLASPQAITYDGKMFFVDKYGNRVAAVIFGPKKVILIAGYNKLVSNLDTALWRIKNIAAVKNAIRLAINTPCVDAGKCMDCSSDERICNVVTYFAKRPSATEYSIILVNEELGY